MTSLLKAYGGGDPDEIGKGLETAADLAAAEVLERAAVPVRGGLRGVDRVRDVGDLLLRGLHRVRAHVPRWTHFAENYTPCLARCFQ